MKKLILIFTLVVIAFTTQAQLVTGRTRTTINQPKIEKTETVNKVLVEVGVGYEYLYDETVTLSAALGWRRLMAPHHYWDIIKAKFSSNLCCMNLLSFQTGYHFNYNRFFANAGIGGGLDIEGSAMFVYELGIGVKPFSWLSIGLNWDAQVFFDYETKEGDGHGGIIGAKFGFEF